MLKNLHPVARAFVLGAVFAAFVAAGMFFRSTVIEHAAYEPNWLVIGLAGLIFFATDLIREYTQG